MTVRMNFGCGSVQPEGWVNVDKERSVFLIEPWYREQGAPRIPVAGGWCCDAAEDGFPDSWIEGFDYIVANHSLSDLNHHQLPRALSELYRVLRPGGVLRVMVPDLESAYHAFRDGDAAWFPQGDDLTDINERFCTFVTWFGTVGSVFTFCYLRLLLTRAGFETPWPNTGLHGFTNCEDKGILELDDDRTTALVMEGRKP